jgi:hypothetical protein
MKDKYLWIVLVVLIFIILITFGIVFFFSQPAPSAMPASDSDPFGLASGCPSVCVPVDYIRLFPFGLVGWFLVWVLYRRKLDIPRMVFVISMTLLVVFSLLFTIRYEHESCGSGCMSRDKIYFSLGLLPDPLIPFIDFVDDIPLEPVFTR